MLKSINMIHKTLSIVLAVWAHVFFTDLTLYLKECRVTKAQVEYRG